MQRRQPEEVSEAGMRANLSYTGVMIDGPYAGEWFTHEEPTVEFVEWGGVRRRPGLIVRLDYSEPISTTYVHVSDPTAGTFWVPEGKTVVWAVQELIAVYREVQGTEAEDTPDSE